MNAILTVLIPTFNCNNSFLEVIKPYLNNDLIKIIVSDDSTDDNEKRLIMKNCDKLKITYIEGTRLNAPSNWNQLLNYIETPFFVLNHHDDFIDNLNFIDLLNVDDLGLIVLPCTSNLKDSFPHVIRSWQQNFFSTICFAFPNATFNMILSPTASVIVNSKLKNIKFDENLEWYVDAEWYLRLFLISKNNKYKIKFFNNTRINSYQDTNSITAQIKNKLNEKKRNETIYLKSKQLYPGKYISFIQFLFLALTLLSSKFKQIFSVNRFF